MNKIYFIVLSVLISSNLMAQTKNFRSENIDSLETAFKDHQETTLSKAYCLDQIVRYHSNHKNFDKASDYIEFYGSISKALKSEDIAMRYRYRNARLAFLKSGETQLDTVAYINVYDYFKINDPRMCGAISYTMIDYLDGSNGFGASWLTNREQLMKWYVIAASDQFDIENYKSAAALYYNASINAGLEEVDRIESLCNNGIEAVEHTENDNIRNLLYERMAEAYFFNDSENEILALEKKIIVINNEALMRNFYSAASYYNKEHLTQKGIEKRTNEVKAKNAEIENGIQEVRTAALAINLPQGSFFTESYDSEGNCNKKSINIADNQIEIISTDFKGNTFSRTYMVHRCYKIDKIVKLLSVSEVKGTDKIWNFKVLISENDILSFDDTYNRPNNEQQQDSLMYELLQNRDGSDIAKQSKQGFEEFYKKERYKQICALPVLKEEDIEEVKETFISSFRDVDDPDDQWYKNFILTSENYKDENYYFKKRGLKNVILEKGFQPFRSIPVFLSDEKEKFPNPVEDDNFLFGLVIFMMFLLTKPWFLNSLMVFGVIGLIWAFYRSINRKMLKNTSESESLLNESDFGREKETTKKIYPKKGILNNTLAIIGTVGLTILGCFLGFFGGWEIGQLLGYTGGNSIGSIFLAIVGTPFGGAIGLVAGIYLILRK